jgi:hypothetical protein
MPARLWTTVALAGALLLLPACSAAAPASTGSGTSTTETTATGPAGPAKSSHGGSGGVRTGVRTSATATPAAAAETIAYTPWGPDDPPVPGEYAALAATADRPPRCDDVARQSPGGPFWTTVAQVCRALTGAGPWPRDATVPHPPAAGTAYQACLDDELTAMVGRALSWHARHPADRPRVVYPRSSSISPCQFRIYDARPLTPDELASAGQGPGVAGIAVFGTGLADPTAVTVDGQPVQPLGDVGIAAPGLGLDAVVVLTAPGPRTARVAVTTARGTVTAQVRLPAGPPSATESPGSSSPGPETSPS